jgi:hypothetical protein
MATENTEKKTVEAVHLAKQTLEPSTQPFDKAIQQQFGKTMELAYQTSHDLATYARESLDLVMPMTDIMTSGYQATTSKLAESAQQTVQRNVTVINDLLQARTFHDALQIQDRYLWESTETFLTTSAQIAQLTADKANEATQKLGHRKA